MYNELLKKFNLLIGEIFKYKGTSYVVTRDGIFNYDELNVDGRLYKRADNLMLDMLLGNVSRFKSYRPDFGEIYYYPNISITSLYDMREWNNAPIDNVLFNRGIICKSKEEAIQLAKQMLNVLDNE